MMNPDVQILIVDDSPSQLQWLRSSLESGGYGVETATDGLQAYGKLRTRKPSLLVSDILMPEMDGYALCRRIKDDPLLNEVPVLLLTSLSGPEELIHALEAGADSYLVKGCEPGRLLAEVDSILSRDEDGREEGGGPLADFAGKESPLRAGRKQMLNLLLATYEDVARKNRELMEARSELSRLNSMLGGVIDERTLAAGGVFIEGVRAETAPQEKELRINYLAHYDPLTKLPNRTLFLERLEQALSEARQAGRQVAVLLVGLERFSNINDTLSYEVGDRILCEISARLRGAVPEARTVARFGTDEFAVILERAEEPRLVAQAVGRVLRALSEAILLEDHELHVGASAGVGIFPSDSGEADGLVRCADTAMNRARARGEGCRFYTPEMNSRAYELLVMESDLRKAIGGNQLLLHYQPQVDLATGRCMGVEALLRWDHPEQGMVPPEEFIPLAEETGLIDSIGEWVLHTACRQNRLWQQAGHGNFMVAVNISARQFRRKDLAKRVRLILEDTGLAPQFLELELTEGMIMEDVEGAAVTMRELTSIGVGLAIDDFGTGYSSLSHLKSFPVTKLKIDRSFVKELSTNVNDAAIADSVIALGHSMSMGIVAEGVETEEQMEFLRQRGCGQGQGYLFSRPVASGEMARFFASASENEWSSAIIGPRGGWATP